MNRVLLASALDSAKAHYLALNRDLARGPQ
jgi:hypothetical protein